MHPPPLQTAPAPPPRTAALLSFLSYHDAVQKSGETKKATPFFGPGGMWFTAIYAVSGYGTAGFPRSSFHDVRPLGKKEKGEKDRVSPAHTMGPVPLVRGAMLKFDTGGFGGVVLTFRIMLIAVGIRYLVHSITAHKLKSMRERQRSKIEKYTNQVEY